jgi:methyl-accepting chemotaxis protein
MTTGWVITGIIAGPLGAILLGFFLAKPLTGKIAQIVQIMAASTNEIAATVEQQERTATRQATSVNQTTITIDELGASSQQSAEQAESAVAGARQALILAGNGAEAVKRTLKGMETLQQKVAAIAIQQIVSAMNDLNIAARETASGISQIRSGTQQLNESAQALKATI